MVEANSSSALSLSATWWNETSSNGTLRGGSHQVYVTSLYLAAYCAVFLLSMVGNVAVVIMVLKISKNGGTRACCFIFNLVMCDLLVGIFCVPFTLIQDLLTDGGLADLMCKMTSTVQGIAVCCSVFTLTTVAILRYRWRDHQQQMEISGTTVLVVSIAMWVVAVLFSSPELVVRRTIQPDPEVGGKPACVDVWPSSQLKMVYKGFLFALCFLGPFFVIGYLWVTVGIKTCCASREPQRDVVIERSHSPSATPTRRKGTKYFRMMKVIVAIFCFLWLPLYVSWTLEAYGDYSWFLKEKVKGYIYPIALWTAFSNSLINPFICGYYIKNVGKTCRKKPRRSRQARKNWESSISSNNSSSDGKLGHIELNSVCGSTEKPDDVRDRILVLPTDKDVSLDPVMRLPTDCSTEPLTRTEVKE
ncbi:neuropeptide FF receptor 2-like [Branchiostoma floridae]|uniref:Neuropeptide FF receptor 2-like n=2 Tax=Branchiostoma floridae TaxID=7739 RepID=A0A9J7ML82_BRAFL|nr:neuropeptide FF receptor 2-like [Branchiostoma floridae]